MKIKTALFSLLFLSGPASENKDDPNAEDFAKTIQPAPIADTSERIPIKELEEKSIEELRKIPQV